MTKSGTGTWGLGRGTRVWDVGRVGWDVGTWGCGDVGRGDVGRGDVGRGDVGRGDVGTWGGAIEDFRNENLTRVARVDLYGLET